MVHRTTEFRRQQRLKDPAKYDDYLQKARERNKKNRDKLKQSLQKKAPDQDAINKKKHILEQQKRRQKIYNKKQKEKKRHIVKTVDPLNQSERMQTPKKPRKESQTRHNVQSRREYNRIKKQEERKRSSDQKRESIRKKDRDRKREKRASQKSISAPELSLPISAKKEVEACYHSKKTKWNVTSQIRGNLPKTPENLTEAVHNYEISSTPGKIKTLEQLGKKRKKSMLSTSTKCRQSRFLTIKSSKLRNAACLIKRSCRILKRRSSIVDVLGIQKFYMREDISKVLPNKRFSTKDGQGFLMQISIKAAHSKYLAENPDKPVSLGKFASLRKGTIKKLTKHRKNYCCCWLCMNIRFKLLTLSRAEPDNSKKKLNEGDLLDIILCPKSDSERFHHPKCINGECAKCFDYENTLKNYYNNISNQQLCWSRWEKIKQNDVKESRVIVTKKGNKSELLRELVDEDIKNSAQGTTFFKHYFTAKWQNMQFQKIKKNLPEDTVLQVMEFAKHRDTKYLCQIKSTFYTASHVNIYPIVNFYKSEEGFVRETCVILTDDSKLDYHAIHHYQDIASGHISNQTRHPPKRLIVFSDGDSARYKSIGTFADLASDKMDINQNYFCSEHGINDFDVEKGVINQAIKRAIIGNKAKINHAEDLFHFSKDNLEINSLLVKRKFFLVMNNEVNRNRPEAIIKHIPKTRKFHQIAKITSQMNYIKIRPLSCFCETCESGKDGQCLNRKYVRSYKLKKLQYRKLDLKHKGSKRDKNKESGKENKQSKTVEEDFIRIKQDNEFQLVNTSEQTPGLERADYFGRKLQLFSQCNAYNDLEESVKGAHTEIMNTWGEICINKDINMMDQGLIVDEYTKHILLTALYKLPDEFNGRVPVRVNGDGNCLPRSGSILAFGTEEYFTEIRCRIIIELVKNKNVYLSLSHINQCVDLPLKESKNLLKTYCMFSEQYIPGSETNQASIERVFENEVLSICKDKTFMGIWHLFGLSSVLHSRIFSFYPDLGSDLYRLTLNRFIPPIDNRRPDVLSAIAWTTTRSDMTPRNWVPNHFVPLIPISKPTQGYAGVGNTFDDMELKNISETFSISSLVDVNLHEIRETSKYCDRKRVNVSGTRLDTAATIRASASMSVLNGEHDTSPRTSLNNGNAVGDSPNVNARKTSCSNLKHQVGQIGINHANSSAQRNYLKNQTENGRRENISYMPLLSKGIASNDVHTSGFTGIKVTDRGPQDSLSQPLYAYANIPCSVNDISESQAGLWNSSSHRNQNSAMTDTYVKKELELNINPISYTGNSLPIQTFQQAETLMTSSQAGVGNTSFQNCSAITVPPERNLFAMTDTHVTKDLHVLPINYSRNSLPMQNVKVPQTLMSQNINATVAMQTNRLFSDYCLTPQNQSSSFHGMSFQTMSAIKCSKYEVGVEDDQCSTYITGLSVTSDGRIILVDRGNENVKMLSQNREKISYLNVNEDIEDVTVYNDTTAVVTGYYKLFFIDISGSELHKSKSIKTTFRPWGIQTCNKNFLVTCCDCYAVKLITENGEVLWSVSEDQEGRPLFSWLTYITCFQDGNQCRVVVSDWEEDTLTVLDGDSGEVIKVCEVKGKRPCGVTTDNTGNIYVCYWNTREIAIWDKQMTKSRILLTNTNVYHKALGFDASGNQLIVSYSLKDYVEIFQLK